MVDEMIGRMKAVSAKRGMLAQNILKHIAKYNPGMAIASVDASVRHILLCTSSLNGRTSSSRGRAVLITLHLRPKSQVSNSVNEGSNVSIPREGSESGGGEVVLISTGF